MNSNYFIGFFLIIETWTALLLPSLVQDEHTKSILFLILYISLIALVCSMILRFISKKFSFSVNFLFCSFFLIIFYFGTILSTLNFFLSLTPIYKICFLFISILAIFGVSFFLIKNRNSIKIILTLFILQISIVLFAINYSPKSIYDFDTYFNKVNFQKKPNIYIFSFDGLSPEKLLKKNLNIEIDYAKKIEDKNFKIFKNAFSENIYTKSALNTLFFLDPTLWRNKNLHTGPDGENSYFSGLNESPLHKILKLNKYKIATGYVPGAWSYQGKFSDEYNLNSEIKNIYPMYCRWQLPNYYLQLLFYCKTYELIKYKNSNFIHEEIKYIKDIKDYKHYIKSINSIEAKAQSNDNWFFFQHIYRPGHTGDSYIHNDKNVIIFADQHKKKVEETFGLINLLIKTINDYDNNSILIIFSDHGPLLTKTNKVDFNKSKKDIDFQILDKHGIFLGILDNSNICKENLEKKNIDKGYYTPTMLINDLIICLSKSNHLKSKVNYNLPYKFEKLENFIYE